jgi:hypothetical protein
MDVETNKEALATMAAITGIEAKKIADWIACIQPRFERHLAAGKAPEAALTLAVEEQQRFNQAMVKGLADDKAGRRTNEAALYVEMRGMVAAMIWDTVNASKKERSHV